MNGLAIKLGESLKDVNNTSKSVWETFIYELDKELKKCLSERNKED
jgi:hypothetical protein